MMWARIENSKDPEDFDTFAKTFPASEYVPAAGMIAAQLRRSAIAAVPHLDPAAVTPGAKKVNPKDGLTYLWIPPGTFAMCCSSGDDDCFDQEKPPHQVTLTRGFWIGQTEVTQEAYQRVTGINPSYFKGARLPVEQVNWNDAQAYCQAAGMRLPTEAEWEYAARGGDTSARYGPVAAVAWYADNSAWKTHEVGQKDPNGFGLYDTLGNVWEWMADWSDGKYYQYSPRSDPPGASAGQFRAIRGGSWGFDDRNSRVSYRSSDKPDNRQYKIGFRCVGE
jgi:formylglycine-generating enzyme required for sulfatase activity